MPCPFATTVFLLYGSIGDAIALTATAPLERIIVILQTTSSSSSAVVEYKNGFDCYTNIIKVQGGFKSLWIGNSYRIVHSVLTRSMNEYFQKVYENLLIVSKNDDEDQNQELNDEQIQIVRRQKTVAEILAMITPLIILYPLEVAIIYMMSSSSDTTKGKAAATATRSNNPNDICKSIIKTSGISSLFKGIGWSILATVQYRYSYYWLYQKSKIGLRHGNQFWPTQILWIVCGIAIQPYQAIQRRLVVLDSSKNNPYSPNYLFVGVGLNTIKIFINGILTTIYGNFIRKIRF